MHNAVTKTIPIKVEGRNFFIQPLPIASNAFGRPNTMANVANMITVFKIRPPLYPSFPPKPYTLNTSPCQMEIAIPSMKPEITIFGTYVMSLPTWQMPHRIKIKPVRRKIKLMYRTGSTSLLDALHDAPMSSPITASTTAADTAVIGAV